MAAQRHSWGEPVSFPHKTERLCKNGCGIVKVTRHEADGPRKVDWTEFWRGLDKIEGKGTPACEPVRVAE